MANLRLSGCMFSETTVFWNKLDYKSGILVNKSVEKTNFRAIRCKRTTPITALCRCFQYASGRISVQIFI
jgi:hypothetical protein